MGWEALPEVRDGSGALPEVRTDWEALPQVRDGSGAPTGGPLRV